MDEKRRRVAENSASACAEDPELGPESESAPETEMETDRLFSQIDNSALPCAMEALLLTVHTIDASRTSSSSAIADADADAEEEEEEEEDEESER